MRYAAPVLLLASLGVVLLLYAAGGFGDRELPGTASARAAEKKGEKPAGLPPLVVDKGAPLLLDGPPEQQPPDVPEGPVADNIACFVCHTNYEEEPFAVEHAKADVGCIECHGKSFAHRDDEDNITPPDVMYWPEKIASNCEQCHEEHIAPAVEVIVRWQERCPKKTDPEKIVCTDCHGEHRLKFRTVWWERKTGKLVIRQQGERIKVAPDLTKKEPKEK